MKSITFIDPHARAYLDGNRNDGQSILGQKIHEIINNRLVHNIILFDKNYPITKNVSIKDLIKHGLTHRVFINQNGNKQRNILQDKTGKQVGDVFDIQFELKDNEVILSYDLKDKVEMKKKIINLNFFDWFKPGQ